MFDLAIIGGGPAGHAAALEGAKNGFSVLLCEEKALGGVCLNEGCIPTKTLLNSAHLKQRCMDAALFGVACAGDASLDHLAVLARKERTVKLLGAGMKAALRGKDITLVSKAEILGEQNGVFSLRANGETHEASRLLIATGSSPARPPIPGLDDAFARGFAFTSTEALSRTTLPQKLLILGGGVIGLEFADYFDAAGVSVTVLELCEEVLPGADPELATLVRGALQKRGVRFRLGARVNTINDSSLCYEQNGELREESGDALLCAVGRRPNTTQFGLETLFDSPLHALETDEHARTARAGVWAAGDVNGRCMLAHAAAREAQVAVNDMCGIEDAVRYDAIPSVLYTSPEAAFIGYTKDAAEKAGISCEERSVSFRQSGRFVAETAGENGLCKVALEEKTGRILGASLCGEYAGEIIASVSVMMAQNLCAADVSRIVFAHPTVGEVLKSVLL